MEFGSSSLSFMIDWGEFIGMIEFMPFHPQPQGLNPGGNCSLVQAISDIFSPNNNRCSNPLLFNQVKNLQGSILSP